MSRPPEEGFVYHSDGESHWRQKPARLGRGGLPEHLFFVAITAPLIPAAIFVMVAVRLLLLPILRFTDQSRGRK